MSVKIENNKIIMTRGDSLIARVILRNKDTGTEYTPTAEDQIRFALKHSKMNRKKTDFADEEPLLLIPIPSLTQLLEIKPEDTKELEFGDIYTYDVEITYADGRVDTFITESPLELTPEVH